MEVVDYDRRSLVTTVDVIIREGKNRQIRRMFEGIGHKVRSITRISHGPIRLKSLRPGEWRSLEQVSRGRLGVFVPAPSHNDIQQYSRPSDVIAGVLWRQIDVLATRIRMHLEETLRDSLDVCLFICWRNNRIVFSSGVASAVPCGTGEMARVCRNVHFILTH